MNRLQTSTALLAAVLGFTALAPKAGADPYDKKVIATFAEPIEVPGGITLQPGTYVFKLQDSQNDRHIVLIQNQRENHTYAQVFATNAFRTVQKGKVQFTFWEAPAGQPKAIRTMYWPGDNYGQSFMYKRARATQIASAQTTKEEVATETETTEAAAAPPLSLHRRLWKWHRIRRHLLRNRRPRPSRLLLLPHLNQPLRRKWPKMPRPHPQRFRRPRATSRCCFSSACSRLRFPLFWAHSPNGWARRLTNAPFGARDPALLVRGRVCDSRILRHGLDRLPAAAV